MPVKNEIDRGRADLVAKAFRDRLAVIEAETSARESGCTRRAVNGGTELNGIVPRFWWSAFSPE